MPNSSKIVSFNCNAIHIQSTMKMLKSEMLYGLTNDTTIISAIKATHNIAKLLYEYVKRKIDFVNLKKKKKKQNKIGTN